MQSGLRGLWFLQKSQFLQGVRLMTCIPFLYAGLRWSELYVHKTTGDLYADPHAHTPPRSILPPLPRSAYFLHPNTRQLLERYDCAVSLLTPATPKRLSRDPGEWSGGLELSRKERSMEGNISPVKSRSAFPIDAQTPVLSTMAHCIQDVQRAMILYTSGILVITSKQQYRLTASLQQSCMQDWYSPLSPKGNLF